MVNNTTHYIQWTHTHDVSGYEIHSINGFKSYINAIKECMIQFDIHTIQQYQAYVESLTTSINVQYFQDKVITIPDILLVNHDLLLLQSLDVHVRMTVETFNKLDDNVFYGFEIKQIQNNESYSHPNVDNFVNLIITIIKK